MKEYRPPEYLSTYFLLKVRYQNIKIYRCINHTVYVSFFGVSGDPLRTYHVGYQPKYQARYQPEGRACRATRRLIHGTKQQPMINRVSFDLDMFLTLY